MKIALVLSGGIALGAYQAGAYAALHRREDLRPSHLAGSSIGAVNAALITGGSPEQCVERLQRFWDRAAVEVNPFAAPLVPPFFATWSRHASSWTSALQTRLLGRSGLFRPRLPELLWRREPSLYDTTPLRGTLEELIDFERLNDGPVRVGIAATDAETGELAIFDTGRGDRIAADHLLASCGFFPDFPAVEIGGRLLGDGGFAANAPIQAVLRDEQADVLCFLVDLFSPRGERPDRLETAASRQWELLLGNQSRETLRGLEREHRLRQTLRQLAAKLGPDAPPDPDVAALLAERSPQSVDVLHLAYRPKDYEAGPEKVFDLSRATLNDRWQAGIRDMEEAMRMADGLSPAPGQFRMHAATPAPAPGETQSP